MTIRHDLRPGSTAPIVVDDLRVFGVFDATYLRTGREAVATVNACIDIGELWLDHDLGGDDTTRPLALVLAEAAFNGDPFPIGVIVVHTANPVGRDWLAYKLSRWYPNVHRYSGRLRRIGHRHDRQRLNSTTTCARIRNGASACRRDIWLGQLGTRHGTDLPDRTGLADRPGRPETLASS